jgi:ribose-5-phosphate isomerase (EC 5.3.1.6)
MNLSSYDQNPTERRKREAARAALAYLRPGEILGVGSGTTVNHFIDLLADHLADVPGVVAASKASEERLLAIGARVLAMSEIEHLSLYIDGADEINPHLQMIKGGGAALTREKILAQSASTFVCIVDSSKRVAQLGAFPLPIEVLPIAQASVTAQLRSLGGRPIQRTGVVTDNGHLIFDITGLDFRDPYALESSLNQIPGIVCNGIFARRPADICVCAGETLEIVERQAEICLRTC